MQLTPPKKYTFWISVILVVLGVLARFIPVLAPWAFPIVTVGAVVLILGLLLKGF